MLYSYLIFFLKFVLFGYIVSFGSVLLCLIYDFIIQLLDILAYGEFYRKSGTVLGDEMGSFMLVREFTSFGLRNLALIFTGLHYYPFLAFGTWAHRYVDTVIKYNIYGPCSQTAHYNVISEICLWFILLSYSIWGSTYLGCGMTLVYLFYLTMTSRLVDTVKKLKL
jgi:hypothetical protein